MRHTHRMIARIFVWLGGAVFVGSLVLCAWWYFVLLAAPGPALYVALDGGRALPIPAGPWSILVNTLTFGVFAAHHSVFARERVKAAVERAVPARLLRSVYVWTASLLLMLVIAVWLPVGGDLYHATGWRAVAHAAVQLFGLWLIAQAVAGLDPLELAGIHEQAARGELQITGPYGWVRHPVYLGWVLILFGAAHMTGDRLAFAGISTLYLMLAVPWEERSLTRSFGDEYRRYQQRVRWRILPYLY